MSYLRKQFKKEFLVYSRKSTFFITPMVFFLISISLYPIGISNDPEILKNLAPGLIWITILLSTLLSFQNIFLDDFEDGSMELLLASGNNLSLIVLIKILVNWIFSCLPIILYQFFQYFFYIYLKKD